MESRILPGFQDSSVKHATEWLEKNGAELKLGCPLQNLGDKSVTFADGKTLEVDLVYKCVGVTPNTGFLKQGALSASLKGPRGSVIVNDHLQLEGFDNIFCAGDMNFHARSNELKLGHTAEVNAALVSKNILRLVRSRNEKLLSYPEGVVGNAVTPVIYDLSLGKYDATLAFNSLVLNGGLAAVVKWMLEWTKVAAASHRPVGIVFWIIADFVSNLLGRTLLPTPMPK
jgi:NADH dehydrogenase FAD-containing subunit